MRRDFLPPFLADHQHQIILHNITRMPSQATREVGAFSSYSISSLILTQSTRGLLSLVMEKLKLTHLTQYEPGKTRLFVTSAAGPFILLVLAWKHEFVVELFKWLQVWDLSVAKLLQPISARGTLRAADPTHPDSLAVIFNSLHWLISLSVSKQVAFRAFGRALNQLVFARVHDKRRILVCKNKFHIIKILWNKWVKQNQITFSVALILFNWVFVWGFPIYSSSVSLFTLLQIFSFISGLTFCR